MARGVYSRPARLTQLLRRRVYRRRWRQDLRFCHVDFSPSAALEHGQCVPELAQFSFFVSLIIKSSAKAHVSTLMDRKKANNGSSDRTNNNGDNGHPCRTPLSIRMHLPAVPGQRSMTLVSV